MRSQQCRTPASLPSHRRRAADVSLYAASAWRGKASDRQRIDSAIDRARRYGYCAPDLRPYDELCDAVESMSCSVRLTLSQTTFCIHYCSRRPLRLSVTFTFIAAT